MTETLTRQGVITAMSRASAKLISTATLEALNEVATKFGLTVNVNGGRFDPRGGTYCPKVEFSLPDSERLQFESQCELVGTQGFDGSWLTLKATDYGRMFQTPHGTYKLVAINLKAPKYPLIAENSTGARFKFEARVIQMLAKQENEA